jgi:poly(A) polymerase Pap1
VICEEFSRGALLLKQGQPFEELWRPTEFFVRYSYYLVITIRAKGKEVYRQWGSAVESRVRFLLIALERHNPQLQCHLYPKALDAPSAEEGVVEGHIFVGLESTAKGQMDLRTATQEFMEKVNELERQGGFGTAKMLPTTMNVLGAKDIPAWASDPTLREGLQQQLKKWKEMQETSEASRKRSASASGEPNAKRRDVDGVQPPAAEETPMRVPREPMQSDASPDVNVDDVLSILYGTK